MSMNDSRTDYRRGYDSARAGLPLHEKEKQDRRFIKRIAQGASLREMRAIGCTEYRAKALAKANGLLLLHERNGSGK